MPLLARGDWQRRDGGMSQHDEVVKYSFSHVLFVAQDVNHALTGAGFQTNIDVDVLVETGDWISKRIGRTNESRAGRALTAKRLREQRRAEESAKL
jgi:hypothetical protein